MLFILRDLQKFTKWLIRLRDQEVNEVPNSQSYQNLYLGMPVNKPFVSNRPAHTQRRFLTARKHLRSNTYHAMVISIVNAVALVPVTPNAMITNQ